MALQNDLYREVWITIEAENLQDYESNETTDRNQ